MQMIIGPRMANDMAPKAIGGERGSVIFRNQYFCAGGEARKTCLKSDKISSKRRLHWDEAAFARRIEWAKSLFIITRFEDLLSQPLMQIFYAK